MQNADIIIVNVTGTNGATRHQKNISRTFNGAGQPLNDDGKIRDDINEVLRNLPTGGATGDQPVFPQEQFNAAVKKMSAPTAAERAQAVQEQKNIQLAYADQLSAWEKKQGGGNEKLQIAKAVLEYTKEYHEFHEEDGNWFVMKLDNLEVVQGTLPDKRSVYQVSGTAVFGA
jgi:hypothetical protein